MINLHEDGISKSRMIAGYVLSFIPSTMVLAAGVTKLIGTAEMAQNFTMLPNWEDKMLFIGLLELAILGLYWIPKTMNMGFFLMLGFMGGALFAEVILTGGVPFPAITVTTLFYIGTLLRKPSLSGLGI